MNNVLERIGNMGLVPVVVIDDENLAVPTAKALIDGGLEIMEITMRTEQGILAIKKVKEAFPDMLIGAGTVLSIEKAKESVDAGAEFIVSPGLDLKIVKWCIDSGIAVTPGIVTPTEINRALEFGLTILKFFPANIFGGIKGCEALYGPYRMVKFIPTGGISNDNLQDFVSKPYIHAIGGGWLCKPADINEKKFDKITGIVKESINRLLGFELAHIGINTDNEKESLAIAKKFSDVFGFSLKEGSSSNFSGSGIEINKSMGPGTGGHIAIKTNSIDRAAFYLGRKGYQVGWNSKKVKGSKTIAVYLENEIGGFAVHLLQK
ncbi:MAG: bifunctional 4-hydroxy-2-oxoglutarate aldolase/2-dehydro-3-deoxy-phosphogluconate aldolase [Actinomycetota bacterium]